MGSASPTAYHKLESGEDSRQQAFTVARDLVESKRRCFDWPRGTWSQLDSTRRSTGWPRHGAIVTSMGTAPPTAGT